MQKEIPLVETVGRVSRNKGSVVRRTDKKTEELHYGLFGFYICPLDLEWYGQKALILFIQKEQ